MVKIYPLRKFYEPMIIDHMKFAIKLAEQANNLNEVPVGCVLVDGNGNLVSYASNCTIKYCP